jgi:hypothetical protein
MLISDVLPYTQKGRELLIFELITKSIASKWNKTRRPLAHVNVQPIAIMLQIMRPSSSGWKLLGDDELTRIDEGSERVQWPCRENYAGTYEAM